MTPWLLVAGAPNRGQNADWDESERRDDRSVPHSEHAFHEPQFARELIKRERLPCLSHASSGSP
jgi:hypothetical protein